MRNSAIQISIRKAAARARQSTEPLVLRVSAADFPPTLLDELKTVFDHFPGDTEVLLEMQTREGPRRLRFGMREVTYDLSLFDQAGALRRG